MDVEPGAPRDEVAARLVHPRQLRDDVDGGLHARVAALQRAEGHRPLDGAGGDRVALGVVAVEEARRGGPVDGPRELPAQVHGVLDAEVEALAAGGIVDVGRVAGQQYTSRPVARGLPAHVGEPGDPGRVVGAEVGAEDADEHRAEVAQGRLAPRPELRLGHDDAERRPVPHPAEAVDPGGVVADPRRRLLGQLDLGDQVAPGRVPAWELDAGQLADQAAAAVAADQVSGPQRLAAGQPHLDPAVVRREPRHLTAVIDRHRQLGDPGGHDPLDLVLEDPQEVGMPRRRVADVQGRVAERHRRVRLPGGEEPLDQAALVQHLERAREQAAGPRAGQLLVGAPLDDRDVDPRQPQLPGQHQPGRATPDDHHGVLPLRRRIAHPASPISVAS